MPKFEPGAIQLGPEDVTSVEMTFHVESVGHFTFNVPVSAGGEAGTFVRNLWTKMLDTYGPGGSTPAELSIEMVEEEASRDPE